MGQLRGLIGRAIGGRLLPGLGFQPRTGRSKLRLQCLTPGDLGPQGLRIDISGIGRLRLRGQGSDVGGQLGAQVLGTIVTIWVPSIETVPTRSRPASPESREDRRRGIRHRPAGSAGDGDLSSGGVAEEWQYSSQLERFGHCIAMPSVYLEVKRV